MKIFFDCQKMHVALFACICCASQNAMPQQIDPRGNYNPRKEVDLVSWKLTDLFLREVMHMEKERIDEIRKLGDRLATYVKNKNDKRFFMNFYKVQRYDDFRTCS